jgi:hypothetical protein
MFIKIVLLNVDVLGGEKDKKTYRVNVYLISIIVFGIEWCSCR